MLTVLLAVFAGTKSFAQDNQQYYNDGSNYSVLDLDLAGDIPNHYHMDFIGWNVASSTVIDSMMVSISGYDGGTHFYQEAHSYPGIGNGGEVDMEIYDFYPSAWSILSAYWEADYSDGTTEWYYYEWYNGDADWD